jgi:hypothetical protein
VYGEWLGYTPQQLADVFRALIPAVDAGKRRGLGACMARQVIGLMAETTGYYQGAADDTTPVSLTLKERQALCTSGSGVEYIEFPGLDHGSVVPEAAKAFPTWTMSRFKGEAARSNCPA